MAVGGFSPAGGGEWGWKKRIKGVDKNEKQ